VRGSIRSYYDFAEYSGIVGSDLHSPAAWDALRESGAESFSLSERRQSWLDSFLDQAYLRERARVIVGLCREQGLKRVFSIGSGIAAVEYFIKDDDPALHLTCTDYAPKATARLRSVFQECDDVFVFDMMRDEWQLAPDTLYLLHRVDTELSDPEWRSCFERMATGAISPVLIVASELLTPEKRKRMRHIYLSRKLHRRPLTFSGYLRTRDAFKALWKRNYDTAHEMPIGDLEGFLLTVKR
jgi:hypothetical protein